jgi:hypothetical protein
MFKSVASLFLVMFSISSARLVLAVETITVALSDQMPHASPDLSTHAIGNA